MSSRSQDIRRIVNSNRLTSQDKRLSTTNLRGYAVTFIKAVSPAVYLLLYSFLFLLSSFKSHSEPLRASLITAWPGSEIYELCGHEAIRIQGDGIDSVWNFGIFNFDEPNFVYRFVKGETDYMVDAYPFEWFIPSYIRRGSRVEEQVLNLTPEETARLRSLLQKHTLPPLNRYRYNYIKNNCSTQIADLLDSVSGGKVIYNDTIKYATYRDAMRAYHRNYPWYQFGIDIALGSGLEEELTQRDELFIPVEFHRHAARATLPDGRPLVVQTNVLYPGTDTAVLPPTPFLLTPLWVSIVIAALSLIIILWGWKTRALQRWWYAFYFACAGLAGCLVFFLVCVSSHAATSPNLLIFWLNPAQLLIPVFIWSRRTRFVISAMMWLNIASVGLLIVLMPIVDRGQAGQPAIIILAATAIMLAVNYLWHTRELERTKGNRTGKNIKTVKGAARSRSKSVSRRK